MSYPRPRHASSIRPAGLLLGLTSALLALQILNLAVFDDLRTDPMAGVLETFAKPQHLASIVAVLLAVVLVAVRHRSAARVAAVVAWIEIATFTFFHGVPLEIGPAKPYWGDGMGDTLQWVGFLSILACSALILVVARRSQTGSFRAATAGQPENPPALPNIMIEARALTKRLDGRSVVSDVNFRCEPGTVTGFLGPNGAGKSTTMRMLVGFSKPDRGEAKILGGRYQDLPNPGRRVGILLDASAQHAGRRGREALAISAHVMGAPADRVDPLLEFVGLDESAGRQRVGRYSLGMRQRLGLAHALLGDPEVLILDEPANGLDPEGMRWMRGLLRDFADRGGTVLLSSHLLTEVGAVADRMMIIGDGRIQAQGTRAELLMESGTVVEAADLAELDAMLHGAGLAMHPLAGDRRLVQAEPEVVARLALANNVVLHGLGPAGDTGLERLFFDLTSSGKHQQSPKPDSIHAELTGATV